MILLLPDAAVADRGFLSPRLGIAERPDNRSFWAQTTGELRCLPLPRRKHRVVQRRGC